MPTSPWAPLQSTAGASGFGILHSDAKRHIFRFEEKPKDPKLLDELRIPPDLLTELGRPADAEFYQGSMGIYVFNRQVLIDALAGDQDDFGKHIIPGLAAGFSIAFSAGQRGQRNAVSTGGSRRRRHHDPQLSPDGRRLLPDRSLGAESGPSTTSHRMPLPH
jgi:hypothetical protein